MLEDLFEAEIINKIRQEKFDNLTWNPTEDVFMKRPKYRSKLLEGYRVPFSLASQVKFRNSVFGTYLHSFNHQQTQDKYLNDNKLGITKWDIQNYTPIEKQLFVEKNDVIDDLQSLLLQAVKDEDCIDWEFLYQHLLTLRIDEYHITVIDCELRNFRNLQVLVLSGNWIEDVPVQFLPRKLQFLELYANEISNLESICKSPPKKLLHIGLGKNKLTDDSNFEIFPKAANKFSMLRSLDLSENDIYDLMHVLEPLKSIKLLTSLQLEGNPCSICIVYKEAVFSVLPGLLYLDNTQVLEKDKSVGKFLHEGLHRGALTFTCHRIIGLPAPPKEKGVVQTIHIEVKLPLLEEITLEVPEELEDVEEGSPKGKGRKGDSAKKKKTPKPSKKGKSKGAKTPSPYEAPDEYEQERKSKLKNTSFITQRVQWTKVIQFPEKALVVESPEGNLTAIRDTFRSTVNVKVIYLKVQPPEKPKKDKGSKKGKKGKDKAKSPPEKAESPKQPQETILKKVTLANFFCDLYNVNWSDETIDFYWAAHPKSNPKAIPVEGSLRAINYVEGKGKPAKETGKKSEIAPEVERIPSKQFLPNIFTCQVGFGLKRL